MLVDKQIRKLALKHDLIYPFCEDQLQPNSYDIRLKDIKKFNSNTKTDVIDIYEEYQDLWTSVNIKDKYLILPGECILASTVERFNLPNNIAARVEGKSSLGRLFLCNHVTAGFIDSGFKGTITLEIKNNFVKPIVIYPNMLIGQIAFHKTKRCSHPYSGKYLNQIEPTESMYYKNKHNVNYVEDDCHHLN